MCFRSMFQRQLHHGGIFQIEIEIFNNVGWAFGPLCIPNVFHHRPVFHYSFSFLRGVPHRARAQCPLRYISTCIRYIHNVHMTVDGNRVSHHA